MGKNKLNSIGRSAGTAFENDSGLLHFTAILMGKFLPRSLLNSLPGGGIIRIGIKRPAYLQFGVVVRNVSPSLSILD